MKQAILKDVLKVLERDARLTPEKVAAMTGHSPQEVAAAIGRAEAEHIILRYKTAINWEKLGEEQVYALIEVKVTPQRGVGFDTVARCIYRFPETRSVYLVSGTYDLAVLVMGRTMKDVAAFVAEKLAPLEFVQGTVTHFLLRRYKEDGEVLEGREELERLPVTP